MKYRICNLNPKLLMLVVFLLDLSPIIAMELRDLPSDDIEHSIALPCLKDPPPYRGIVFNAGGDHCGVALTKMPSETKAEAGTCQYKPAADSCTTQNLRYVLIDKNIEHFSVIQSTEREGQLPRLLVYPLTKSQVMTAEYREKTDKVSGKTQRSFVLSVNGHAPHSFKDESVSLEEVFELNGQYYAIFNQGDYGETYNTRVLYRIGDADLENIYMLSSSC